MTDYSGTLIGNRIESLGPTSAYPHGSFVTTEYDLAFRLTNAKVDASGTVTGTLSASGTVTRTFSITGPVNPAFPPTTTVEPFALAPTGFTTARNDFNVEILAAALGLSPPASVPRGPLDTLYWSGGTASWDGTWTDASPSYFAFNYEVILRRSSSLYGFETVWIPVPTPDYPNAVISNPGEGDSGTTLYSFDLVRDIGIDQPASVAWAVQPFGADPASPDDFAGGVFPTGIATFTPGQARVRITVPIAGDTATEQYEQFRLIQPDSAGELLLLPNATYVAGINDDDIPPRHALAAIALDVLEGDAPGNLISFRIDRTAQIAQPSDITWRIIGIGPHPLGESELSAGSTGTVHFSGGEASATVSVPLAGGTVGHPDRRFVVAANDTTGQFGTLEGLVRDDDAPPAPAELAVLNATTGQPHPVQPGWYNGPVYGLEKEVILLGNEDIVLAASTPNWFLHTGSGNDAIAAGTGINVIDGGSGSNFLSGHGQESYFIDARGLAAPVWSTVLGLDRADSVSIWIDKGTQPQVFWEDNQGAEGYRGLTLHVAQPGRPIASLTMPGFTLADSVSHWEGITWVGARVYTYTGASSDGETYLAVVANI